MIDLTGSPLVETDWLAEHLDDPDLRVVDARWRGDGSSGALYLAGHIPGAVHLDWHYHLSHTAGGVRDLILPPEAFAAVMSARGIGDGTRVVAYAETDHSGAARLWWALRYYGHEQVAVLNGGITKWTAEGRPLRADPPQPPLASFTPRPQPSLLATADEIQAAIDRADPEVRLVDSRPPEQYTGLAVWTPDGSAYIAQGRDAVDVGARRETLGGRIPGAVHWHASMNLNPADWTYLAPNAIREAALALGVRPENRVITYCGCGISASLGLFALYVAGFRNLALYDASWEEWGTDPARPIERKA